ncbi:MAG: zinc-dependent peptidase [Halomonas sp.]|uniref:M90 family metallopeptidase n=1 Tax=Halomonas sp. TaxID=1486246 RepID=UPI003F900CDD
MFGFIRRLRQWLFLTRHPFPEQDWQRAMARLPILTGLDEPDAQRLGQRAWRFMHDKHLSLHPDLADNIELGADQRLAIAAQICLLTLGWNDTDHRDMQSNVHELQVLPGAFKRQVKQTDAFGVTHDYEHRRAGETSYQGPVVASWPDVVASGSRNGFNVLIHEFAHKIDMRNSVNADGYPPLSNDMSPKEWHRVYTAVWDDLQSHIARGETPPIDAYAASLPGECFAVTCEIFFSAPEQLDAAYPELYDLLKRYFRQDPLARFNHGPAAPAQASG